MSGSFDIDVSAGGGGGADEEDFGPVYEFLNGKYTGQAGMPPVDLNRPSFGTDFSGKGYGGGGIRGMNFGSDWATSMIGRGFSPDNFGLPGNVSDYAPGGQYNPSTTGGSTTQFSLPGYGTTTGGSTGESKYHEGVEEVEGRAQQSPLATLEKYAGMGMDMGMDMGIGSLSPTTPSPFESQTGIFGGTLGPKLRNSLPGKIIRGALQINPGTRGLMMGMALIRGAKNAENPQAFLKKAFTQMAMSKAMGKIGLDPMQRGIARTGLNIAQGKQNWKQGLGSLGTSAAFQKLAPSIFKQAHQKGGMPAVYGVASLMRMLQQGAQRGVSKKLAGPGGGG